MSPRSKLVFPRVSRLKLKAFSLYTLQQNLDIEIPRGVFCLAGANGLGKSTFLAAVNFGLTGFVPDPSRPYRSTDEYYKLHRNKLNFTETFFSGRIAEFDRDDAEITLDLCVGDERVRITRGIFSPSGLIEFSPIEALGVETHHEDADGLEIERDYQKWITNKIGLENFEQFAFLQHMVLTFDESRHLLMWDPAALNEALFLAIGTDPQRAAQATRLRQGMNKAGSRARNLQFQVNNVVQRLNIIHETLGGDSDDDIGLNLDEIRARYESLEDLVQAQQQKLHLKQGELRDFELARARASAKLSSLREDYNRAFSVHLSQRSRIEHHPIVAATLSENECAVCGADGVSRAVQKSIEQGLCPLCGTHLPESSDADSFALLQSIDKNIALAKADRDTAAAAMTRLSNEVDAASTKLEALKAELKQFEAANRKALLALETGGANSVADTIKRLRDERRELLAQRKEKYAERDAKLQKLLKLQDELKKDYAVAENEFVPLLQSLARAFLGVDLIVRAIVSEGVSTVGFSLELEMRGSTRRGTFQLSESQRFFLDIALRMALAQYMFSEEGEGALFVDTPEGSLDIAYEARAGEMFAKFTEGGAHLIMTANINTSQLLRRLALVCRRERMTVHRMTSWTELSDVQIAEETLFEGAYDAIEEALGS